MAVRARACYSAVPRAAHRQRVGQAGPDGCAVLPRERWFAQGEHSCGRLQGCDAGGRAIKTLQCVLEVHLRVRGSAPPAGTAFLLY